MPVDSPTRGLLAIDPGAEHHLTERLNIDTSTTQTPSYLDDQPITNDNSILVSVSTPSVQPLANRNTISDTVRIPPAGPAPETLSNGDGPKTPTRSSAPASPVSHQAGFSPTGKYRTGLRRRGRTLRSSASSENTFPTTPPSRSSSFQGIQTPIPSGDLEDPFGPDRMKVSNRGSLYIANQRAPLPIKKEQPVHTNMIAPATIPGPSPVAKVIEEVEASSRSILSIDSQRQSQKVRSLYEQGIDYRAAESERPASAAPSRQKDHFGDDVLGELRPTGLSPRMTSFGVGSVRGARSVTAMSSRSSMAREPGEIAGGAEDWTDVDAKDVDRYGFISRSKSTRFKRSSSNYTAAPGSPGTSHGHRQAISLDVISETDPTAAISSPRLTVSQANGTAGQRPSSSAIALNNRSYSPSKLDSLRSSRSRRRRLLSKASAMLNPFFGTTAGDDFSKTTNTDPMRLKLELKRSVKWQKMAIMMPPSVKGNAIGAGSSFNFHTKDPKLISRSWKGIPDRWRATAWHSFLTTSAGRQSPTGQPNPSDSMLITRFHDLQEMDCLDDMQIDLDVPRTIGQHVMFRKRYRGGQRLLFRVLRALSLHFPDIGYVQGMAAIVSTLLCYYDEELAFVMAVRMWTLRGVAWLYTGGFDGLMEALEEFEADWIGLGDKQQALKNKLQELGVTATVWGAKWYLTLFNYSLPFQAQLRVWDVFLLLGDPLPSSGKQMSEKKSASLYPKPNLDVLHAVAASLLLGLSDRLLQADFDVTMEYLTGMVMVGEGFGEDVFMGIAKALMAQKGR